MITEELYINEQLIELPIRSVSRTLQINDFGDVVDRQSNYSNSIKIPNTISNKKAFKLLGIAGVRNRIPYENVTVKYVLNGIELISEGKGIVKKTGNFYNLVIYDGNISMTELLGSETMSELDFSSYNHNLTYAAFLNSFAKTSGYIYGTDTSSLAIISNTIPCFFIHTLFDMIFTQKGWDITGNIFDDADYKSRVTTMDIGFEQSVTESFTNKYTQANSGTHGYTHATTSATDEILVDTYNVVDDGVFKLSFIGNVAVTFGSAILRVKLNGTSLHYFEDVETSITEEYSVYAEDGDTITVYLVATTEDTGANHRYTINESFTTNIDIDLSYIPVSFEDLIGSKKQIDFVKEVMQRFNLSFRKVRNKKELEFISSEVMLTDFENAENWSDKLKIIGPETYSSNYAQENIFKYNYDESENAFADGKMLVDNVNLSATKTILTSIFKASKKISNVFSFNYWDENGAPTEDGLRIFKIIISSQNLDFILKPEHGNYTQKIIDVADLDFTELSYQNELDNNYAAFNATLNNYKQKEVLVQLSELDVYNLDFFKLKYFNQLGRYYYLNKVKGYVPGEKTKLELIQVPIL